MIGVRGLSFDEKNKTLGHMEDGEVEDGKNAHDLYRIVNDLSSIIQICHTLDV